MGGQGAAASKPVARVPAVQQAAQKQTPVMMFVGDSFTVGSGPVRAWETYATETARQLGWQPVIAGAGGTGYVSEGRVGRTFQQSFVAELAWRPAPDLLIISGGHNDRRWPATTVRQAAARLVWTVKGYWPNTRIVMVGPIWIGEAPPQAYRVRDALAEVAARERVAFLDPLGQRWIDGRRSEVLLPDGVHPTLGGHAKLARWLTDALRAAPA
ncbi:SGNH/GDSL hydrolase family protein [Nonomuraea africana]|uniref:Lysophospholipase L1-like esterase n=1 Tax=Nonomuraea africana TaxID=46171 RepID=A0ABR9KT71_9ACTN|nr:SGNH/GDSL hydrolase family protein [Nonomuraea africana]MBE1565236.1 lysophospholipase L1-like esterase [Nonomuraea africana]